MRASSSPRRRISSSPAPFPSALRRASAGGACSSTRGLARAAYAARAIGGEEGVLRPVRRFCRRPGFLLARQEAVALLLERATLRDVARDLRGAGDRAGADSRYEMTAPFWCTSTRMRANPSTPRRFERSVARYCRGGR